MCNDNDQCERGCWQKQLQNSCIVFTKINVIIIVAKYSFLCRYKWVANDFRLSGYSKKDRKLSIVFSFQQLRQLYMAKFGATSKNTLYNESNVLILMFNNSRIGFLRLWVEDKFLICIKYAMLQLYHTIFNSYSL